MFKYTGQQLKARNFVNELNIFCDHQCSKKCSGLTVRKCFQLEKFFDENARLFEFCMTKLLMEYSA